MQRETATHSEDLPHSFKAGTPLAPAACGECSRHVNDPIHSQAARELASEHGEPAFPRETGS